MTVYHKHHIIPKHMGGTNDSSNLATVTVEQHAALHKQLWEDLGCEEDRIAWLCLSGQITCAEAIILAVKNTQQKKVENGTHHFLTLAKERVTKGTHHFLDSKFQSKQGKKGFKKSICNGTHISLHPDLCSISNKKRIKEGTHPFVNSNLQKAFVQKSLKEGTHSSQKVHICPKCGKIGKGGAMKRYHFEKCKKGE